jgi:acyl carrier protein
MDIRQIIIETFDEVRQTTNNANLTQITDEMLLMETGIDSLGFAVIVVQLEEKLGFDPFSESDEPFYPRTVAEFVAYYQTHAIARTPGACRVS